ncbi:MAG TPA: diacylglycerol kinase [Chiayiivirga sp.]|jgi:diacylglycerol kinase (ATP)|uniref:Diacylglycerol kinase n=1 Tax=Denitratimonas tolerans TaxID=1338420 RepID=A0AAW9R346_9GAMM|nr:diacylglycerol kinase [Xanthomonadaceae bacterium]MDX9765013.1 diacylglycerol kinase [Chiayiivirga sp.]MEB2314718.1 diacylglycerol kinase [Xanthomonadaceae bacterium]HRN59372.1 diacylglycerol kinase [Chiayiivirga sp.]HRO87846.1 diacylglycerol kinase [Chiayiivirga sp.]
MADSERRLVRGPTQVWRALQWSLQGLAACWRLESSFRLECLLALVLAPLGLWLGQTPVERVLLVASLLAVIAMEVMNSALESVADRFGTERNELIGRAKDMGSAAVFVLMMNVLLVWGLLLLPRLWA